MKKLLIFLIMLTFPFSAAVSQFTEVDIGLPGVYGASAEFGDYDGDGDLDILMGGSNRGIYRNDGGVFVNINAGLPDHPYDVAWGDFDNDGDVDALMNGAVYRNDGGSFSLVDTPLHSASSVRMEWVDYDGDGDLDISQIGTAGWIWRNDNGTFVLAQALQWFVREGGGGWGDYDNDGDPDILLTGTQGSTGAKTMYLYSNKQGILTPISNNLIGFASGTVAWGDYDNDGDDDVLVIGEGPDSNITYLYKNQGGVFTLANSSFPGLTSSDASWGDMDNDGDLDLAIMGAGLVGKLVKVYRNNGGEFAPVNDTLPNLFYGGLVWGDYDQDGDLDLLISGSKSGFFPDLEVHLFRNDLLTPNEVPSVPSGLQAVAESGGITLSWSAAADDSTPSQSLSYNVRVGTTPGGHQVVSSQSDITTGHRYVARPGNAGHKLSKRIYPVIDGTYFWSVQTIDNTFGGSPPAAEQFIVVNFAPDTVRNLRVQSDTGQIQLTWSPNKEKDLLSYRIYMKVEDAPWTRVDSVNRQDTTWKLIGPSIGKMHHFKVAAVDSTFQEGDRSQSISVTPQFFELPTEIPDLNNSCAAWGDYDNDGDLDIAIAGYSGLFQAGIFRNDNGIFVNIQAPIAGFGFGTLQWGDYDHDGDLDLLAAGNNVTPALRIYRNDSGVFQSVQTGLPNYESARASWGDFDNDGDLDLFVCGYSYYSHHSDLYRWDESEYTKTADLFSQAEGPPYWIDIDSDGLLDIFLATQNLHYRNTGTGFTLHASLGRLDLARASWGDYDGDGDADILINGHMKTLFYKNNGGALSEISVGFADLGWSFQSSWGDVDNDGDLDVVMGGISGGYVTEIYRNNGSAFENLSSNISDAVDGFSAWADVDRDMDLDLLISGYHDGPTTQLHFNAIHKKNTIPTVPANNHATVNGNSVTFQWDKSSDVETVQASLTYNIYTGTSPGSDDVISPAASIGTGFVRTTSAGNAGYRNSYTLKNLKDGTYYWGVQSLDNAFMGSPFSSPNSFKIDAGPPAAPTLISVIADTGSITLRWSRNKEADLLRYRIYAGRSPSALVQVDSASLTDTLKVWSGFVSGAPLYFRMAAVDEGLHVSAASNLLNVTPPLSPAIRLSFTPNESIPARIEVAVESDETLASDPIFEIQTIGISDPSTIPMTAEEDNRYYGWFDITSTRNTRMHVLTSATDGRRSDLTDTAVFAVLKKDSPLILPSTDSSANFNFGKDATNKTQTVYVVTRRDNGNLYQLLPANLWLRHSFLQVKRPAGSQPSYVAQQTDAGWTFLRTKETGFFWTADISQTGTYSVIPKSASVGSPPQALRLNQNYPNPFNFTTKISFDVDDEQIVRIEVYNIIGQKVKTLFAGAVGRGQFATYWDGSNSEGRRCSSGVYILKLTGEKKTLTRRLLFLK